VDATVLPISGVRCAGSSADPRAANAATRGFSANTEDWVGTGVVEDSGGRVVRSPAKAAGVVDRRRKVAVDPRPDFSGCDVLVVVEPPVSNELGQTGTVTSNQFGGRGEQDGESAQPQVYGVRPLTPPSAVW